MKLVVRCMNMKKRKGAGSTEKSRTKITKALLTAFEDLRIEVTAPYIIEAADGRFTFIALVHGFGSPCGTLVGLPDDWETLGGVADGHGFYFSCLYPSYETYERQHFLDTLNDWGWAGDEDESSNLVYGQALVIGRRSSNAKTRRELFENTPINCCTCT